jgi:regulator of RNase E activity RraA
VSDIITRLGRFGTSDLSDALDRFGINGQCAGIMPLVPTFRLVGRAFTVRYAPIGVDGGTVGDYIDDVPAGNAVVLENGGRRDATVWGDLLTAMATRNELAGTVIDGVCRDLDRSVESNYPIFACGHWMRTGKDRVRVDAIGEPVSIGGVRVTAGDYLRGDGDGIVVVPAARIDDVLEAAEQILSAEDAIRDMIAGGATLRQARADVKYHSLQSKVAT